MCEGAALDKRRRCCENGTVAGELWEAQESLRRSSHKPIGENRMKCKGDPAH